MNIIYYFKLLQRFYWIGIFNKLVLVKKKEEKKTYLKYEIILNMFEAAYRCRCR